MKEIEIFNGYWSVDDVKSTPEKLFIFGDNDLRIGTGGQAVIRNNSNTYGIRTKKRPSITDDSYYSDTEYEFNTQKILQDILQIKFYQLSGVQIVLSDGGYGTGLSMLKEKAPKTYDFLLKSLRSFLGYDNDTGKNWKYIPSFDEFNLAEYVNISDCFVPINNSYFRSEHLEKSIFNYFDLIKNEYKVAFTSNLKFKPGQIINLNVGSSEYLVVRVCDSYSCEFISKQNWSVFEGVSDEFITDKEIDGFYQTQFQFICTLNPDGTMRFKQNIFN